MPGWSLPQRSQRRNRPPSSVLCQCQAWRTLSRHTRGRRTLVSAPSSRDPTSTWIAGPAPSFDGLPCRERAVGSTPQPIYDLIQVVGDPELHEPSEQHRFEPLQTVGQLKQASPAVPAHP